MRKRPTPTGAGQERLSWGGPLGHAKASMTLDVYADLFDTDLFDADLDEVAVNLDAAIRAAADEARQDASR